MSEYKKARDLANFNGPQICTVGVVSHDGYMLTGQRRDNKLWTSPGGHRDANETILEAARREVMEESGIEVTNDQLELIKAERVKSHRTGKDFVVFAFLAKVERSRATAKNDPDKEISEWRWVPIDKNTPELKPEARHAKQDFVLMHLGVWPKEAKMRKMARFGEDPKDKGRTMKQVSDDLQKANLDEKPKPAPKDPEQSPTFPEPKAKTPQEMQQDPEEILEDEDPNKSQTEPKTGSKDGPQPDDVRKDKPAANEGLGQDKS
jgi:8-oxo-dGTP pyrophosphatase MutT (NUDIX family)